MQRFLTIGLIVIGLFFAFVSFAQINPFDVEFPIAELGNCNSFDECKVYCDNSSNKDACIAWVDKQGFIGEGKQQKMIGPGGCSNEQECEAYCSDQSHGEECLNFAVSEGFVTSEEAEEMRKNMNKTGPGGCASREECDVFCSNPDNTRICLQSAVDSGMISQEEADFISERDDMRNVDMGPPGGPRGPDGPRGPEINEAKVLELLAEMDGPGGCSLMDECDNFCSQPENDEECMDFAIEHGLIPEGEIEKIKKMMEQGGPGGCRGRAECDAYCEQQEHQEECFNFAVENKMMSPDEIERTKKFMEIDKLGGPGGCRGRAECDAYCDQPGNGEECFAFGKQHGLMPPEEIGRMEKEMEIYRKLDQGAMTGPGGCMGKEECSTYCGDLDHLEECMNFSGDHGLQDKERFEQTRKDFERFESTFRDMKGVPMMNDMPMGPPMHSESERGFGVILKKQSSGVVDLIINHPNGIQDFMFKPSEGSHYSGGISGCPREFKTDSSFFASAKYPITAEITNCDGDVTKVTLDSPEGRYNEHGGIGEGPGSMMGPGPEDFQHMGPPPEFDKERTRMEEENRRRVEEQTRREMEEVREGDRIRVEEDTRRQIEEEMRNQAEYESFQDFVPQDGDGIMLEPVHEFIPEEGFIPMPPIEEFIPPTEESIMNNEVSVLGFILQPFIKILK